MPNTAPRLIAFYFPQFHPIPENDAWWGTGFTDWTNVAKARSLFRGHYQPHVPADLGYYDLRLPEARQAQANLARAFGIHGFCYYHYWFNGKLLLERPLAEVLTSGKPDFPFCLCWANENWTRVWDGEDDHILQQQTYSAEDDVAHFGYLLPALRDPRHLRIDGKPLLLVYRVNLLPKSGGCTSAIWREEAARAGLPGLYLCTVNSYPGLDWDPAWAGFDAAVDFQPDWKNQPPRLKPLWRRLRRLATGADPYCDQWVYSYPALVRAMMARPEPAFKVFPGVTPGWDNSPRVKDCAIIYKDSTPELYGRWLRFSLEVCRHRFQGEERLVFANAWNEWGEGNHLEPDMRWGHRYLEETRDALRS